MKQHCVTNDQKMAAKETNSRLEPQVIHNGSAPGRQENRNFNLTILVCNTNTNVIPYKILPQHFCEIVTSQCLPSVSQSFCYNLQPKRITFHSLFLDSSARNGSSPLACLPAWLESSRNVS